MIVNKTDLPDFDWLKIKHNKVIATKDHIGKDNGFLIDILNRNDEIFLHRKEEMFQQFYMTTVEKHCLKGLHVHPYKMDTIFVPVGKITLVLYTEPVSQEQSKELSIDMKKFAFINMGEDNFLTVSFPSKYPHGFWGRSEQSVIINYRFPAWNPEDVFQFDLTYTPLIIHLNKHYI